MVKQVSKVKLSPEEDSQCKEGELLSEVVNHKGWVEVLRPFLEKFLHHSWVNPRECKDEKDFMWQELQRADYAQFTKELLDWMDNSISTAEQLRKKEKGEIVDKFRI